MRGRRRTCGIFAAFFIGACATACGQAHGGGGHEGAGGHAGEFAGEPSSVAIAPVSFDALYVVDGGESTISVVNAETNAVAARIELVNAPYPHHANLSADGKLLVVAIPGADLSGGHEGHGQSGGEGAVLVLDAATGATIAARRLPAANHNGVLTADAKEVWTSQVGSPGSVLVLDAATLETRHEIAVGNAPAEVTFSPDGKRAFVANGGTDDVTILDVASKEVVGTVAVGDNPVGAWPGADGKMYVDNEAGKSVSVLDPRTLEVVGTYDLGFTPGFAATTPNGELWVTDADAGRVTFWSTADQKLLGAVETGAGAHAIAFSADFTRGYVTNQGAGTLTVIDVASRAVVATVRVGQAPNGLVFRKK